VGGLIINTLSFGGTGVVTIAGSFPPTAQSGNTNGAGSSSLFDQPRSVTTDGTNLYVTDRTNSSIRKIVISTGVVSTFVSGIANPEGITTDGANLYVTDVTANVIYKIVIATQVKTTLAGGNSGGGVTCSGSATGCKDGTGTAAQFNGPREMTTDGTNLYVADRGNLRIRKIIISSGVVTTLAGDGTATLGQVDGITTDGNNLYATDTSGNRLLKVSFAGAITSLASISNGVRVVTTDGSNLYIMTLNGHELLKYNSMTTGGSVTSLAGLTSTSGYIDGNGTTARLNGPRGITTDGTKLYFCDVTNNAIRSYY